MRVDESLVPVALSFIKGMDGARVKAMIASGYTAEDLFGQYGLTIPGMEWVTDLERRNALRRAASELEFMKQHRIIPLYIEDPEYPAYLAESGNPPIVLYMIGKTDLNPAHSISIVGTRKSTPTGVSFCTRLTEDISGMLPDTLIVSGLAYGIDAAAHNGALASGLPTVGVLAHGLDMIYPAAHRGLASSIINEGGALLTEYPHGTKPHRSNFLERNRIVATMTQGVVLAESPERGGSMSTASIAFSYSREVMAVPGRPTDVNSSGCNLLIKTHKAHLVEGAQDICRILGWEVPESKSPNEGASLFPELDGETRIIYEYLKAQSEPVSMDTIAFGTSLPIVKVMTLITDMEFNGLATRYPGNRFEAVG